LINVPILLVQDKILFNIKLGKKVKVRRVNKKVSRRRGEIINKFGV